MSVKIQLSQAEMQERLRLAASSALNRIRLDRDKAPKRSAKVFTYLEQHIFSQSLDVNQLSRACGRHPNAITALFRRTTGTTPHGYIAARRMETAAVLLTGTGLMTWMIAELIGFSSESVFCRNFKKWAGLPPRIFHERARLLISSADVGPDITILNIDDLREAIEQGPNSPMAAQVVAQIKDSNIPDCQPSPVRIKRDIKVDYKSVSLSLSAAALEKIRCQALWEALQEMSLDTQKHVVRSQLFLSKPTLFHFLLEKSVPEGRDNREYGIHLAELAMDCLRVTERRTGKHLSHLECQGWAWLGNAQRLAYNFTAAEDAFSIAEAYLPFLTDNVAIAAEVYHLKSALRRWQRRFPTALALNSRALRGFYSYGTPKQILWALIEKANIHEHAGDLEACILSLNEALKHVELAADTHLRFGVFFNLASALAKSNAFQEADELLPTVRKLREQSDQETTCSLLWLEGFIKQGLGDTICAESLLQDAHTGFLAIKNIGCASLVALDLSILLLGRKENRRVVHLTAAVIPVLESLSVHREAKAALKVLQQAMAENQFTIAMLQEVRERLDRIRLDPMVKFDSAEFRNEQMFSEST
ncbi:MAG: helix-turn-helix transcriptional regulator [Deltaproteobacteria bacterium]|nr:helix-turn-helix transcriptional regulator [Deltaproteobacteria bacterium]